MVTKEGYAPKAEDSVKLGRPTDYSPELADKICKAISQGNSLKKICDSNYSMPCQASIFNWLTQYPDFLEKYTKAKEQGIEAKAEELEDIGDEAIEAAWKADPKAAGAIVQAYKLKIDNMKWAMSKLKPKKYGDKIDMTTNGKDLPTPILAPLHAIPSNDSHTESNADESQNPGNTGGNVGIENG